MTNHGYSEKSYFEVLRISKDDRKISKKLNIFLIHSNFCISVIIYCRFLPSYMINHGNSKTISYFKVLRMSRCFPFAGGLGVSRCCPFVRGLGVSRCCPFVAGLGVCGVHGVVHLQGVG